MSGRGQANLPVLAVALITLTSVTALSLTLADGALATADRDPLERHAATAVAERLVSAEATTLRPNVLDEEAIEELTLAALDRLAPPVENRSVRVRVGDETLVERGDPSGGATVRRIVLVADRTERTRTIDLGVADEVTLPRRTTRVRLAIDPGPRTTVTTVRANGRVVLHRDEGLTGEAIVRLSRYETTSLSFEIDGPERGTVAVTYVPTRMTKAVLEVTVDA